MANFSKIKKKTLLNSSVDIFNSLHVKLGLILFISFNCKFLEIGNVILKTTYCLVWWAELRLWVHYEQQKIPSFIEWRSIFITLSSISELAGNVSNVRAILLANILIFELNPNFDIRVVNLCSLRVQRCGFVKNILPTLKLNALNLNECKNETLFIAALVCARYFSLL